jgi:signal transduction histidine kinase
MHAELASGRLRSPRLRANGILRTVRETIVAKHGSARLAFDRSPPLVDRDACKVNATHPGVEPKSGSQKGTEEEGNAIARAGFVDSVVFDITRQDKLLRQAQLQVQELVAADRRKDEFLAMLSHELRSPLSAIHYALGLLRSQAGEADAQRRMQALIERQVGRMTQLVDELLDVSRITNSRLRLSLELLDLRAVVNDAIETLESELNERNHRLVTELPDAPVWVHADRFRLEQVFVNLIANASRYTDAGGELAVRVHTIDGEAVVRVRDSGIGIARHLLAHVFDLFKQVNEDDPRSRAGLGVGLAVVRKLVELHKGSVAAASAGLGLGSEFTVRLPASPR